MYAWNREGHSPDLPDPTHPVSLLCCPLLHSMPAKSCYHLLACEPQHTQPPQATVRNVNTFALTLCPLRILVSYRHFTGAPLALWRSAWKCRAALRASMSAAVHTSCNLRVGLSHSIGNSGHSWECEHFGIALMMWPSHPVDIS